MKLTRQEICRKAGKARWEGVAKSTHRKISRKGGIISAAVKKERKRLVESDKSHDAT